MCTTYIPPSSYTIYISVEHHQHLLCNFFNITYINFIRIESTHDIHHLHASLHRSCEAGVLLQQFLRRRCCTGVVTQEFISLGLNPRWLAIV